MRFSKILAVLVAALSFATTIPALADLGYTPGQGAIIFDWICFTTKHCSAHVPINSAGTEIATFANPIRTDPTGTTTQPVSATVWPLPAGAATSINQITGTQYGNQANWVSGVGSSTATTATQIIAAPGANKLYIKSAQCSRDDAGTTAIRVTFNDAVTTPLVIPNNGGGGGNNAIFDPPIIVASTTAFQFTSSTAITTVRCSAQGYNAP